jgi:hypothetical protein
MSAEEGYRSKATPVCGGIGGLVRERQENTYQNKWRDQPRGAEINAMGGTDSMGHR